ncbi:PhzF family phenazine biosynthesis protein [Thalassotalea euphylliae]|uniref:PhzF family phenazine biosynthesis protein n=1 Tax=Thalassotalea euphylliae TaxID=1655234 RepID=UPI00363D738D
MTMYQVDAFTNKLFSGNPAAVIVLDEWLDDQLMLSIATENNLSETAYVKPLGENRFAIRWFSPLAEIDFCGHATLASSKVLYSLTPNLSTIEFSTQQVGELTVIQQPSGLISMTFPIRRALTVNEVPKALYDGLSISPRKVLRSEQAYFAIYDDEADVKRLTYDTQALTQLAPLDVVVTAPAAKSSAVDFVSRYFWPANGGDEDPVTGSIHAGLAPYWAAQLNKTSLTAYQASKRGGTLYCEINNDNVIVSGYAVLFMTATIDIG